MNTSSSSPLLELNNATVYRGEQKVLNDFSLSMSPKEHTAVVGPNGSGKSTLVQLLTRELYPIVSKNECPPIRIFGESRWEVSELRKHIGIVSTDLHNQIKHNLNYGKISGRDVVLSGFFSSMQLFRHQHITDEMRIRAEKALESMKAADLAEKKYAHMSSGEARRVLVARALVLNPEMLILDEPTTALDFVARETCLQFIRNIAQEKATVIIVTHHIEEIIPEIKNVLMLKEGSVAFYGTKEKILTSQNLSFIFDHPVTVYQKNGRYRVALSTTE